MTEKEEKELIKRRASYKGRLTAFSNYINDLEETLNPSQINELQLRIGKMENLYEQYDEVQLRLECIVEDVSSQINERNEFESLYYKHLSKAHTLHTRNSKSRNNEIVESEQGSFKISNHKLVKLPTIQLPKFSGSYENWLEFRDTFSSLIHSNYDIDDINKFHYLRASLEGTAAVVIQSIEFSATNYSVAWNLLCERFDNKRLLIQNHVTALFNIEIVTKESSYNLKRIIDTLNKNLRALESLGEPTKFWDTLLIHIVTNKLDSKTYREWEEFKCCLDKDKSITLNAFYEFLRNRADLLETLEMSKYTQNNQIKNNKIKSMVSVTSPHTNKSLSITGSSKPCPKCHSEHNLHNCSQFLALTNDQRLELLPQFKVCFNCFRAGHYANHCKSNGCKVCKRKHNTLIHISDSKMKSFSKASLNSNGDQIVSSELNENKSNNNVTLSAQVTTHLQNKGQALLATSLIKLYDVVNCEHIGRAILDSGSTSCLITERLCRLLNLPTIKVNESLIGINNSKSSIGEMCCVPIKSLNENFSRNILCFILPSITDEVPNRQLDVSDLNIPSDICLADPHFYMPSSVDLIIGADVFWDLLGVQKIYLGDGKPVLFETRLGWIVSGPVTKGGHVPNILSNFHSITNKTDKIQTTVTLNGTNDDDIQNLLMRFWQLEEVDHQSSEFSEEEKLCEAHFCKNVTRLENGRFCVRIPLKQSQDLLGDSLQRAKYCLLSMERRFKNQTSFKERYCDFMAEYRNLGHMSVCTVNFENLSYFIPHHGVVRETSTTTKLRVVFNASSPTTSGVSLNSIQMVGPTVQDDLLSILLRFRKYKYVLSADVEKMYRQIIVHPDDRHLQQILWRDDPSQPIVAFQLNTVTYGTASAPFLATRCLKQIGIECNDSKIATIIIHDFYVDDLLTGADTMKEASDIRIKVTNELAAAGMSLRKWKSNTSEIVFDDTSPLSVDLNIGCNELSKTLGLSWHTESDDLCFLINPDISSSLTKRGILSVISQIFDPLGLLAPCIILMKIVMQKLWVQKLSWDEQLPLDISRLWIEIVKGFPLLNNLRIPRLVLCDSYKGIDLHVFTDASQLAYGACLYVRSFDETNQVLVRLLTAKSRVAPIKPSTIPRLELCAALVGVRLYKKVVNCLRAQIRHVTFWTDSTIVLGWLKMLPSKLQPFVRNRVAEILEETGTACTWRHVPTNLNPADHISRGINISQIQSLDLWWTGPHFLKNDMSEWPKNPVTNVNVSLLPETRSETSLFTSVQHTPVIDFNRFSNFSRLKRSVAYVLRFINICKKQKPKTHYLNDDELQNSLNLIIKLSQIESFPEYQYLLNKQNLPTKSPLLKFNVFMDDNNLLRIGGRLVNSQFQYEKKHPLLVQSTHRLTKLLFEFMHKKLMHAGPQLLLASIKEKYWPIGGLYLAKSCYRKCVLCCRLRGKVLTPLMGNLPQQRLRPNCHPFETVGVDYAGPIMSASRQGRGCRLVKVYIVLFVCFTTKAVHIELVGDLTSSNFISALRRFISRRGKPKHIYSDNGTSFVGAYHEIGKFLKNNCDSLSGEMATDEINFHFIPPYAPHFGGLWEAGIKSTKYHLKRVLGNCNLTFEELNTVLVQIEAILNSRPLTPLSSDPEDLLPLTPGHFLIGRSFTSLPSPNLEDCSRNYLTRFQRIEQLRQHFWSRWSKEYVSELQQRIKWRSNITSLKPEALVLLKDDTLPPLKWRLGRIVAVHPGSDGINRVADIKTACGVTRRAFSKICPLPEAEESG